MSVTATLEVDVQSLDWHHSVRCVARLRNDGDEPLRLVNADTHRAVPWVLVTDEQTGQTEAHGRKARLTPDDVRLEVPGQAENVHYFELWTVVRPPRPGKYSLRVRYSWAEPEEPEDSEQEPPESTGPIVCESEPVEIEVLPSDPQNIHLVPATGGGGSVHFGAWTRQTKGGYQVVLASLGAFFNPAWTGSRVVAEVGHPVAPVNSLPPRGLGRWRDYVGWIEGSDLAVATLNGTDVESIGRLPVGEGNAIVPPLLEHLSGDDDPLGVDVVLQSAGPQGIELRAVRLARGQEPTVVPLTVLAGAQPTYITTAYRFDGRRVTLAPRTAADGENTELCAWTWPTDDEAPAAPRVIGRWRGRMVRMHHCVGAEHQITVAALLEDEHGPMLQGIRIDDEDAVEVTASVRIAGAVTPMREAMVQADPDGSVLALVRTTAEPTQWSRVGADGVPVTYGESLPSMAEPITRISAGRGGLYFVVPVPGVGLVFRKA
ncbi:MAG: hypothetical protein AAF799_19275 [Myxococcota bacterium]